MRDDEDGPLVGGRMTQGVVRRGERVIRPLGPWSEAVHEYRAGRLIRDLHDASHGFRPRRTAYRFHPCPPRPGQIISHGDLGPWNTVYRNGLPAAFIDFDSAGPVDPVDELAAAAWAFAPLAPDRRLREAGFDPVPDLAARLCLFVDAYGLPYRPATFLSALQRCVLTRVEQIATWPLSPADAAGSLEFLANELRWLHTMTPALERALSGRGVASR